MDRPRPSALSAAGSRSDRKRAASFSSVRDGGPAPADEAELPLAYRLAIAALLCGILGLWLYPLRALGGSSHAELLRTLGLLAGALLLTDALRLPRRLRAAVRLVLVAAVWLYLADAAEAAQSGGWLRLGLRDAVLLVSGRVTEMSGSGRLALLLAGWGLLVWSVGYLAAVRGSCLLFTAITVAYLAALDRGLELDTLGVTAAAAALLLGLHGLCGLIRLREKAAQAETETGTETEIAAEPKLGSLPGFFRIQESGGQPQPPFRSWCRGSLAAAALIAGLAWCLHGRMGIPERDAPGIVPMLERLRSWDAGYRERSGGDAPGAVPASTGYGTDARTELGRPLHPSDLPVFRALTPERTYWRGESYDRYDGRRWSKSKELTPVPLKEAGMRLREETEEEAGASGERRKIIQQVVLERTPPASGLPLFAGGEVAEVASVQLRGGSRLGYVLLDEARGDLRLPGSPGAAGSDGSLPAGLFPAGAGPRSTVTGYKVSAYLPLTDPAALRREKGADPAAVRRELQLPGELPDRVRKLARQLTASAATRYDAAVAVRDYLRHTYAYTLNTRIPPADSDFVDDFLFTARRGYCVHFATAMTVLLRSAGIPARYTAGYGPGTPSEGQPGTVTVTDADSHAWVEVYFPGAGWVPFDPTPAASGLPQAAAGPGAPALPRARAAQSGGPAAAAGLRAAPPAAAAALLAAAAAWRRRRTLALLRLCSAGRDERLAQAAALAWAGLAARYGAPPPGRTGREYADSLPIDDAGLREAVRRFVRQWETLAYRRPPAGGAGSGGMDGGERFLRDCRTIVARLE
ncbi:transglutaminase domain-containing protein [Paenibacillus spiritus]|uniref:Transglutaminase domain-containing protein n=1 Tax=Paenibacillus spiritus TaxID=2496557 RepID=A0A5J5FUM2_9BACL|nr:transglutaminase-like domain-containing protein [Paenibacillus spiritus]KAA8997133.1 transglutaminase domain-containing protein [Paenibacillus spiritus]